MPVNIRQSQSGFSLLQMVLAVAIVAILVIIAMKAYVGNGGISTQTREELEHHDIRANNHKAVLEDAQQRIQTFEGRTNKRIQALDNVR